MFNIVVKPIRAKGMVRNIEDWPWSNYLAFTGHTKAGERLTSDWVLFQFGRSKKFARENYKRFVLKMWSYP